MQPTVLINQHRQTAVIVAQSGSKQLVVELEKGMLTVSSLSAKDIRTRGYIISDYSPRQAALSYLRHAGGVSERARRYLEDIAHGEFSATLLFG